jgi:hypothetical protein
MKPWYVLMVSFLLVSSATLVFLNYKDLILSKLSNLDNNTSVPLNKPIQTTVLVDKALTTLEVKNETINKAINTDKIETTR